MKTLLALCAAAALGGCGNGNMGDDGLSAKDKQAASRIDAIAKRSGGDWDKVPQTDKDYLVNEVSMGSEQSAKMLLQQKAGTLRGNAGGPPKRP